MDQYHAGYLVADAEFNFGKLILHYFIGHLSDPNFISLCCSPRVLQMESRAGGELHLSSGEHSLGRMQSMVKKSVSVEI